MLEDLAAHAHQRILSNGGVTLNLQGHEPSSGYAYSPYPELERVLPASGITPQHVHQYMMDNHSALSMPGNHLGAWHDQQSGNVFLDISHVGDPTPETIQEAKKQNQLAVFDLSNFQEIPTGLERSRDVTSAHEPVWDWNVAEQQFVFPPKFVSDDPEGIIRATQGGYKVKPHIPVIEPPEWQWHAAVHPEWFDEWMRRNGPYIAHSTSGPETKRLIERHGLIPWDAPGMNSKYTEDMMPRPNHVYVRHPHGTTEASDKHTVYFDMRKLDPERIHADEDPFFDSHTAAKGLEPHLGHPEAIRDRSVSPSKYIGVKDRHGMYPSFGEWAEHHKLNEPAHVAHSLNDYGTLAIEGGIDPAAIVSPDEVRQWHQVNGNWENNPWSGTPRIGKHDAVPYNYPHTPVVGPLVSADDRAKAMAYEHMKELGEEPMSDIEPDIDMSQIDSPELNWSLNSSFKLTTESDASIYTREGKRLNVTNQDDGVWHVAGPQEWVNNFIAPEFKPMIDKHTMPQQQTCYFHHDRPAVVEEGGAPMCHECSDRYNQAMLATRPDMRQAPQHMLSNVAWSWCSPLG